MLRFFRLLVAVSMVGKSELSPTAAAAFLTFSAAVSTSVGCIVEPSAAGGASGVPEPARIRGRAA